ncbi:phage major capsid protein [Pseudonocardia asaccharolytica]|uniref:Phage capsid-like C-terminal domain-containing protein n=1 Tax=Pseudonocardia asaccharolytica DSM 44247 = NBRC 16224 TaxID=1123024 RepID=A0A511D299_9PSEU|nr:phage major capsid protein [Pseudonocardia asaccharolytica]GEL17684.1 hypothetical protein PA7_15210 [Pseudonocardia asaccharolytica DSM 44247 = NBRC 16224]
MASPYLVRKREQYQEIRTEIEGLQALAVAENRDLTEDELGTIRTRAADAEKLAGEIESLADFERRSAKVGVAAAEIAAAGDGPPPEATGDHTRAAGGETRSGGAEALTGTAQTRDRDPGHYRKGGEHSFFGDMFRAKQGYQDASRRLAEHHRALDTPNEGVGLVAPHWLVEEYQTIARQGRRASGAVRQVPLGDDPRPLTLPRQTAGTDTIVAEQASENTAPTSTDAYDSDTVTVTPKPTTGAQVFSRQMLDMANPAIDGLIYGDLLSVYNQKIEAKVVAAMVTAAGTAVTTYANEAAWDTAAGNLAVSDDLIDLAIAVRNARKLPADILVLSVARYGELLKLKDSAGRPLMPMDSAGPMNVVGTGSVAVDGRIHGLGVIASDGVTQYPESILAARAADTLLFESALMRFRYEEKSGPHSIEVGIWGYSAVHVKYSGDSVKRNVITAAV